MHNRQCKTILPSILLNQLIRSIFIDYHNKPENINKTKAIIEQTAKFSKSKNGRLNKKPSVPYTNRRPHVSGPVFRLRHIDQERLNVLV